MARHYSPKSFFRHVPNAMLKQYFSKTGVLIEHDFSQVPEAKIEPIYKAWLSLPDALQRKTERDFKEIDALACEGGIKAIIDEARRQGTIFLRPLERRRARTFLPPVVFIRARNPVARLRLILLG